MVPKTNAVPLKGGKKKKKIEHYVSSACPRRPSPRFVPPERPPAGGVGGSWLA
jgi:hypothetical protein